MDDCNSVQNVWTSCFLVEAWVLSVTMQCLCPKLFVFYNIHKKGRIRPGEMAQRFRLLVVLTQAMSSILSNHMVS